MRIKYIFAFTCKLGIMTYKRGALQKVEKQFTDQGFKIRYERGNFKAGYCIVQQSKVIIVNKFYNNEARYNCLIEIMEKNGLTDEVSSEELQEPTQIEVEDPVIITEA